MKLVKLISNKLEEVRLMQELESFGIEYELICFLYKGKEPVYYTFLKGSQTRFICNALSSVTCLSITEHILLNRDPTKPFREEQLKTRSRKLTFTDMKLLKITR